MLCYTKNYQLGKVLNKLLSCVQNIAQLIISQVQFEKKVAMSEIQKGKNLNIYIGKLVGIQLLKTNLGKKII